MMVQLDILNHIKMRYEKNDEEYNTKNFENAIKKVSSIISKENKFLFISG